MPSYFSAGMMTNMATIERSIEINVSVASVYRQWIQCENFAQFMEGVELVQWLDERRLHWRARIAFRIEEWDAEITEQIPEKRIAWCSITGAMNAGVVTFHRLARDRTRLMLQLDCCPRTWAERAGIVFGVLQRRVRRDLRRFKVVTESRRQRSIAWENTRDAPPAQPTLLPLPPARRARPQLYVVPAKHLIGVQGAD